MTTKNAYRKHNLYGEGNGENPIIEFDTFDELRPRFSNIESMDGFSHFSVDDGCLMAIYDGGFRWFVIGYVRDQDALGLPEWDKGLAAINVDGQVRVVAGDMVNSYCGDDVTLNDGRVFKRVNYYKPDGSEVML